MLQGIHYVTDERGNKLAVQIDLRRHRSLWEDFNDVLVAESRRREKNIPLDRVKGALIKRSGKVA